jgi:hypothetical protein
VVQLKSKQLWVVMLAALAGVALLTLAVPRMKASLRFLPVDLAIEVYYQEREIPTRRILTLIGFAEQAIAHHDHYRYHDGLSFLYYLRGLDRYTPALERRPAYRESEAQAIETVKRAPAQPEAWLRIATVRSVLRDEPDTVIEPWKMSIFTGRTHSTLLVPRVEIGLPLTGQMDAEATAMLRDQLLLAWELKPVELLRALKQHDPGLARTRALAGNINPAAVTEMEARIEKVR